MGEPKTGLAADLLEGVAGHRRLYGREHLQNLLPVREPADPASKQRRPSCTGELATLNSTIATGQGAA
jgi:hypothetical protein